MANQEHVEIVKMGAEAIREWREKNPLDRLMLDNANLRGANLGGARFGPVHLDRADLYRADLSGANLREAQLRKADLSEANLTEADLSGGDFTGTEPCGADLTEADLSGANLSGANLSGADLTEADLTEADLRGADLSGAKLIKANLSVANLSGANLSSASLSGAGLGKADLGKADLNLANLNRTNLIEANLGKADLTGADLTEADLSGAKLGGASLTGASLCAASLCGADLCGASLCGADLTEADLTEADLRGADLSGAKLIEANLSAVDLRRADLCKANLREANLRGVGVGRIFYVLIPFYRWPFVLNDTHIRDTRFARRVSDPWSVLRRNYTGAQFLFHLLFLVAFILPYVGRTIFWVGVNRTEEIATRSVIDSVARAADYLKNSDDSKVRRWAAESHDFCKRYGDFLPGKAREYSEKHAQMIAELSGLLDSATELVDSEDFKAQEWAEQAGNLIDLLRPYTQMTVRKRSVWQMVIGWDRGFGYTIIVLAAIGYNVCRWILTYSVGGLREQADLSGDSPEWKEYRCLFHLHQVAAPLLIVVVLSFLCHAWYWLTLPVFLPG